MRIAIGIDIKVSCRRGVGGLCSISSSFFTDFLMENCMLEKFGCEKEKGGFWVSIGSSSHAQCSKSDGRGNKSDLGENRRKRVGPFPWKESFLGQAFRETG